MNLKFFMKTEEARRNKTSQNNFFISPATHCGTGNLLIWLFCGQYFTNPNGHSVWLSSEQKRSVFPTLLSPIFSFFLGLKTKVAFENVDTGQCHPEQYASDLTSKGTAEASPLLAFLSGTLLNGLNPSSTSSSPFLSRPWITAGGRLRTTFSCRKT